MIWRKCSIADGSSCVSRSRQVGLNSLQIARLVSESPSNREASIRVQGYRGLPAL